MDKKTAQIAKRFAFKVRKRYSPVKIILFGSRARGDYLNRSDFDFLIISKKFENIPFMFRASDLYGAWSEAVDIEPLCYTPEEFERKKKKIGIVRQAVKEGIEILAE